MKNFYGMLKLLIILGIMTWSYIFLVGIISLFIKVSLGALLIVGLSVALSFVLGASLCLSGRLLFLYLPKSTIRHLTAEEQNKVDMAWGEITKPQHLPFAQKKAFGIIYITDQACSKVWVFGRDTLILSALVINCPTKGVLEGSMIHAHGQKVHGEGVTRSVSLFLGILLKSTLKAKCAMRAYLYGPLHRKFSQGKPIIFTKDIVMWTGATLGLIPWFFCTGAQILLKGYNRLYESQEVKWSQDDLWTGLPVDRFYKKYLLFLQEMPVGAADFLDFCIERGPHRSTSSKAAVNKNHYKQ